MLIRSTAHTFISLSLQQRHPRAPPPLSDAFNELDSSTLAKACAQVPSLVALKESIDSAKKLEQDVQDVVVREISKAKTAQDFVQPGYYAGRFLMRHELLEQREFDQKQQNGVQRGWKECVEDCRSALEYANALQSR